MESLFDKVLEFDRDEYAEFSKLSQVCKIILWEVLPVIVKMMNL